MDADPQLMNLALANLRKDIQSSVQFGRYLAGSVTLVSAATSAGYALWALRSAHFVTTFLATIPAWRELTPDQRRERWEEVYRIHTMQRTFGSGRKPPGPPR